MQVSNSEVVHDLQFPAHLMQKLFESRTKPFWHDEHEVGLVQ
jgi:hypothetical protein